MIKVFIVDDHKLILDAWCAVLEGQENILVCGTATESESAYTKIKEIRPDICLVDINLKNESGIELTKKITETLPKTRVIALTMHDDMVYVKQMLKNGASGYLTKNIELSELLFGLNQVHNGKVYICNEIRDREFFYSINSENESERLTERETELIPYIVKGLSSKEIAEQLSISKRTVDVHRFRIMKKLEIDNLAGLISWANKKGYA